MIPKRELWLSCASHDYYNESLLGDTKCISRNMEFTGFVLTKVWVSERRFSLSRNSWKIPFGKNTKKRKITEGKINKKFTRSFLGLKIFGTSGSENFLIDLFLPGVLVKRFTSSFSKRAGNEKGN